MQIDPWTVAFQALNFLVLVYLLQRLLYRPVLEVLDRRRQAAQEADDRLSRAKAAEAEARAALETGRQALVEERERSDVEVRRAAEAERAKILERARAEAQAAIEASRKQIAEAQARALEATRGEVLDLAVGIARRLLADAGTADATAVLVDRLLEQLGGDEEERRALLDGLDGEPLVVAAWPAPTDEAQRQWRERLQALLGTVPVAFEADPELLAGLELRTGTTRIATCWRDAVADAREALGADR